MLFFSQRRTILSTTGASLKENIIALFGYATAQTLTEINESFDDPKFR
jgi:hypothetical protein